MFHELNKEGYLDGLELDVENAFDTLGIGSFRNGNFSYIDLVNSTPEELYDLMPRIVGWAIYVSERMAETDKRRRDSETEMDAILNKLISTSTQKVTEAKATAKGSEAYIKASYRYNTLEVYHDYLERVLTNLDKFHYIVKMRIQLQQGIKQQERHH